MEQAMVREIENTARAIREQVNKVLVGKEKIAEYVLAAYFAGGHVLLEDMPGTGKTMLARTLAKAVDGDFKRIQFTPDLLPADITGLYYFDQKTGDFLFRKGPIFADIVLADEINRATPRTQSSLLEGMEEKQVSVDGQTKHLTQSFFVIATQNPVETLGTFPLPEAQLDRFMMKLSVGFPTFERELDMMDRFITDRPEEHVEAVCKADDIRKIQNEIKTVYFHRDVREYLLRIVEATRRDHDLLMGASPRSTLAFMRAVQAFAVIRGRSFVTPDDVKELAPYVLGHRIVRSSDCQAGKANREYIQMLCADIEPPVESFSESWAEV